MCYVMLILKILHMGKLVFSDSDMLHVIHYSQRLKCRNLSRGIGTEAVYVVNE